MWKPILRKGDFAVLYQIRFIYCFVRRVFPMVDEELKGWQKRAGEIPDSELRQQALASIAAKRFHAQGGAVYVLYPGLSSRARRELAGFIVAYQTISDYLDNLCDRAGVEDAQAFRQLHFAMDEALVPGHPASDYYRDYPYHNDGGYLEKLVKTCQTRLSSPYLKAFLPTLRYWAALYSQLQTYKHIAADQRDQVIAEWIKPLATSLPELYPWEIEAATGSTLGIFYFAALAKGGERSSMGGAEAYFPWVCSLHILLDYFIDRQEDLEHGDLNFVQNYEGSQLEERLGYLYKTAKIKVKGLAHPDFHILVLDGLLALYLSDPKALVPKNVPATGYLLAQAGGFTKLIHKMCQMLRRRQII